MTFFAKNLIGKCQISNSREGQAPLGILHKYLCTEKSDRCI